MSIVSSSTRTTSHKRTPLRLNKRKHWTRHWTHPEPKSRGALAARPAICARPRHGRPGRRTRPLPPGANWPWVKLNGIPFWGRCTTHFRTYFSGDWDVHWGCDRDFDHSITKWMKIQIQWFYVSALHRRMKHAKPCGWLKSKSIHPFRTTVQKPNGRIRVPNVDTNKLGCCRSPSKKLNLLLVKRKYERNPKSSSLKIQPNSSRANVMASKCCDMDFAHPPHGTHVPASQAASWLWGSSAELQPPPRSEGQEVQCLKDVHQTKCSPMPYYI